jgi:predicted lipoprotein
MRCFVILILLILPFQALAAEKQNPQVVINSFANQFAVPEYTKFQAGAAQLRSAITFHCADPSAEKFAGLKDKFTALVKSWARIEIIRFGPARKNNRFERILFWPDVKSRVSKGVNRLLADESADFTSLITKSVVVQGLPALEYLIYSNISEKLERGEPRACQFASAIAGNLQAMSKSILQEWTAEDGFGGLFKKPSENNSLYRQETEVLAEILKSVSEHVQIMTDIKIKSSLGRDFEKSKPKRAPLWRSNMTAALLVENTTAVLDLFQASKIALLLDPNERGIENTLKFEAQQIMAVLTKIKSDNRSWVQALEHKQTYEALAYVRNPIGGVHSIFAEQLPEAFGLNLGFNSLDGD